MQSRNLRTTSSGRQIGWGWRRSAPIKSTSPRSASPGPGSTSRCVHCAFFYGVTLGRTAMVDRIPYARQRQELPVILSAEEVARFFAAAPSPKHRMALMTAYAAGLRVSEVVRLKITDIDSGRMLIRVEQGKGGRGWFRHALAAVAHCFARVLARSAAGALAVPRSGRGELGRWMRVRCSGRAEPLARQPSSVSR